jgi:hypothetical protein
MSLIGRLFAPKPYRPATRIDQPLESIQHANRRELVTMAVSDTLRKSGIPATWITAETYPVTTPQRQRGMHLRLCVREWQPTLLDYGATLQKLIKIRIARLDPFSSQWLAGVTWKFDLIDDESCPSLPGPTYWQDIASRPANADTSSWEDRQRALRQVMAPVASPAAPAQHAQPDGFSPTEPMPIY